MPSENDDIGDRMTQTIAMAQRIEHWPLDKLKPYDTNPRTHSADQVQRLADLIEEFGFTQPILVASDDGIIAGHGRLLAAQKLGMDRAPVIVLDHLTPAQRRAYVIADNKVAELGGWDVQLLAAELEAINDDGMDLELVGFSDEALAAMLGDGLFPEDGLPSTDQAGPNAGQNDGNPASGNETGVGPAGEDGGEQATPEKHSTDEAPEPEARVVSHPGDVWLLGRHRVMCGDSTNSHDVAKLMAGRLANLLHADPPYGMGKEADGVANDNLRGSDLDGFQMDWWGAFRPHLESNASAYIWGNAPDLWRLWFKAGLGESEPMSLRNEIVWDKKSIAGMASPELTQYPEASERCLFFQLGRYVFQINQTKDDYWPGWESIRAWLCEQRDLAGFSPSDVKCICGNHMYGHWFTQSQWSIISEDNYAKLAAAAEGKAFTRPYADLRAEYERLQQVFNGEVRDDRVAEFRAARPFFDNAHDIMRDVWEFPRVTGDERHGHATPKPVAMMARVMKSSTRHSEVVAEPFGGSGATLMGAEDTGRVCFTMELQPRYCDVIVRRWQKATGKQAVLEGAGDSFDDLALTLAAANDDDEAAAAAA